MSGVTVGLLASALCVGMLYLRRKRSHAPPLPSPPSDPILGHLRYMPEPDIRDTVFCEWGRKYGDVFMLNVLGNCLVVINSEKAAVELMEKRSATYSDRPPLPVLERCGWKDGVIIAGAGQEWAAQRKLIQRPLAKATIPEYASIQEEEVRLLLSGLLEQPQDYFRLLRRYTAGILTAVVYGHRIHSVDDEYYKLAEDVDLLYSALHPTIMDISPYFEYLPSWFPGAWFIDYIKKTRPVIDHMIDMPLKRVWDAVMSDQVFESSLASQALEAASAGGIPRCERTLTLWHDGIGGVDTSLQTLHWFIATMVLNPDIQSRAQSEIDEVVGRDRLPTFADRDALPYIQCLMQETPSRHTFRTSAQEYNRGCLRRMRIPKGAIIMVNSKSLTLDENHFHEPHKFKPERFLQNLQALERPFLQTVSSDGDVAIACMLSVFTFSKAKDVNGKPIEPEIKYETGLVRHPKPFVFEMRPRDEKASLLIKSSSVR
ncbi:cytochrome P450 [Irpex lacteus]|nr:cytochrome P450 [Irpex lacteus]